MDSDVFVLPTFYDACSLVVLEAMAAGLPVITTESNGVAGLIENGHSGTIIPHPPASDSLVEAMNQLMSADKRFEMSRKGNQSVQNHTMEKAHKRLIEIFEEIASGH